MSAPSAVQLTCLPAPLVVHQDLPVHRKCLISGKSHSKWGWFQKSTWRRDSCGHSLEWELASSLGKTYLGLFFCMDVHHFLRVLSFSFSENFNIYVQKGRKIFPLLQRPFYHLWNPHESSLSEYTGECGALSLSLNAPLIWAHLYQRDTMGAKIFLSVTARG